MSPEEIKTPIDPIRINESILRQVSRETTFKEVVQLKLFDRLQEAMKKAWTGGVGLAAIQIGVPLRFAFYKKDGRTATFLLNPRIVSGRNLRPYHDEGCLSLPNQRQATTWRYDEIVYKKLANGKMEEFTARGFEALVIQHEIDHMNGILCSDRTEKPRAPRRNEMCPCGSGKKFKKCCEAKGVPA